MTPESLLIWTLSTVISGLAVCLLALGIRGTIKIFIDKEDGKDNDEYQLGHPRPPKVPPANYQPPLKPPKQ